MNHKRRRPKNRRAGCLMCKPWKANCNKGRRRRRASSASWKDGGTRQEMRANASAKEQDT